MVDWLLRQERCWHEQLPHCRLRQCWRWCHILSDARHFRLASPPVRPGSPQGLAGRFHRPVHHHCRHRHHVVVGLPRHPNREMERTPPRRPAASRRPWHHRQRRSSPRRDQRQKDRLAGIRLAGPGPGREDRIRRHGRTQGQL